MLSQILAELVELDGMTIEAARDEMMGHIAASELDLDPATVRFEGTMVLDQDGQAL